MKILSINRKYIYIIGVTLVVLFLFFAFTGSSSAQGLAVPEPTEGIYYGETKDNPIFKWIQFFMNILTVVIVAGSAVMIAIAGLQYTSARDNAQSVQAAKQKITNVFIGLISYFFLFGFMQWLIPGGVF